mmetsp:Transcript_18529/g.28072  ORF Transcript_18529/g.28072 Transcript_18529/m.28072 type:complete len:204 (-) Transcript_18529:101-712(-)
MAGPNAFTAAIATCSSSSGVTPLTPTAPIHTPPPSPSTTIGTPPRINTNGAESNAALLRPSTTFAESSNAPVALRNDAAVFAFPTAISYDAGNAPSVRFTSSGVPPGSDMAIVTLYPWVEAHCSAAESANWAAAEVSTGVVWNSDIGSGLVVVVVVDVVVAPSSYVASHRSLDASPKTIAWDPMIAVPRWRFHVLLPRDLFRD